MVRRMVLLGIILAMSNSSIALAQGQRGQRGRGPGGDSAPGVAGLLGIAEVRKELGVTTDQQGLIEDLLKDLRESGGGSNRQDFQNLSQEERRQRFAEARKQAEERAKKTD